MKTFVSTGEKIDVLAPAAIAAGAGILIGSLFGVAQNAAALNAPLVIQTTGVVDMAKAPSQAWTFGAPVYWDNTAKVATTTVGSNRLIGVAVRIVAAGVADIVGRVRLNGSFTA